MLTDKEKSKIGSLKTERKVEIFYGLLRMQEVTGDVLSGKDFHKASFLLEELVAGTDFDFSRFKDYFNSGFDEKKQASLLAFLERIQGLSLRDEDLISVETGDKEISDSPKVPLSFVLHNIRSAFNIGSLFRAADCIGVEKIYLTGYTAGPDNEKVSKTAMGCEDWVSWEYVSDASSLLEKLNLEGVKSFALETVNDSPSVYELKPKDPVALWVGNEAAGLEPEILKRINNPVRIPTYGKKNSLNVAQALTTAGLLWGESLRA